MGKEARKTGPSSPRMGCLFVVLLLLAAFVAVQIYTWPTTNRYRITVRVETPEGLRTGSSVVEVKTSRQLELLPDIGPYWMELTGEAVAVDLPGTQTLFALLRQRDGLPLDHIILYALGKIDGDPGRPARERAILHFWASDTRGQRQSPDQLAGHPLLVRFANARDPKSVEEVDPRNLAKSFGPGVRLKNITVEIVDSPETKSILQRLPWLPEYRDKQFSGKQYISSYDLADNLAAGAFKAGGYDE